MDILYFLLYYIFWKKRKKFTVGWSSYVNEIQIVAHFVQANRGSDGVQEKEIDIRQHCVGDM